MEEPTSQTFSNTVVEYLKTPVSLTGWVFWLIVVVFIFFLLWLFFGRGDYEYVGLKPLKIGVDSTRYINDKTYAIIEKSKKNAQKITGDQVTLIPVEPTEPIEPTEPVVSRRRVSKGEQICRQVMEELYNKPFPTIRPDFLKNPETKRNLELDCYNDELKLAVEYNGVQHYKWPNFTNQSKEDFIKQVRRDKYKVEACDANGVYLITVPYNVPHKDIKDYIIYYLPENYQQRIQNTNCSDSLELSDDDDSSEISFALFD